MVKDPESIVSFLHMMRVMLLTDEGDAVQAFSNDEGDA